MSKKIMLEKGQDPTKMEFADPRPNPLIGCLIGLFLIFVSSCCAVVGLLAAGVIQWPS